MRSMVEGVMRPVLHLEGAPSPAAYAEAPLHHALRARSPSPSRGGFQE